MYGISTKNQFDTPNELFMNSFRSQSSPDEKLHHHLVIANGRSFVIPKKSEGKNFTSRLKHSKIHG